MTTSTREIGQSQLSMFALPVDGECITDKEDRAWRVCLEGGFRLRAVNSTQCHPEFLDRPMMAGEFCWWWNRQLV